MAERIIDLVDKQYRKKFGGDKRKCKTHKIPLANGGLTSAKDVKKYRKELQQRLIATDLKKRHIRYLVANYGRQADIIISNFFEKDGKNVEEMLAKAELAYLISHESVHKAADYFIRRTGRLYFLIESVEPILETVLSEMASYFNWDEHTMAQERKEVTDKIYEASQFFKVKSN